VLRYARGRAPHYAEDIAAAVFTQTLASIRTITWQGRDFGAWLTTVTRNRVADYYKNAHTRLADAYGDDHNLADFAARDDPHAEAEHHELGRDLLAAISRLSHEQADVVQLRYLAGLSTLETARRLGINEGAVKARLNRALSTLRRSETLRAHR
jgi:RNA polymerase sigma-70 factor (ECF subfamily)